ERPLDSKRPVRIPERSERLDSTPPIGTPRGAGFVDRNRGELWQQRFDPVPYPNGQVLRRRVLESLDLVQYAMVELAHDNRLDQARDLVEVDQPPELRVDRASHRDLDLKRMPVHAMALVLGRQHRQAMRGFETKRLAQLDLH